MKRLRRIGGLSPIKPRKLTKRDIYPPPEQTVIEENINPIEKLERSLLVVQSAIHGLPMQKILKKDMVQRVLKHSPMLFDQSEAED